LTQPIRRDVEIEELTNRFFIHPVAGKVAILCAQRGITPNMVSLTGMACGILAGFAYYHYRDFTPAIIGFLLMIAWHIADGADGQLARLTGAQSEVGKVLDGICDYVTFFSVYIGLGLAMARQDGAGVLLLVALAGACHAAQAAAYEAERQDYVYWAWGRGGMPASIRPAARDKKTSGLFGALLGAYEFLQSLMGNSIGFNRALYALLDANPAEEEIRARYRGRFAPAIRHWSILSSNYRTLAIFIFALLRMPVLYFVFEIIVLSGILFILGRQQTERATGFLAEL
jgi:phosphatidylglycerophosphate synthase